MRTNDFGGFSSRTCSIDLRFTNTNQFDHFMQAWTSSGRPDLHGQSEVETFELLCVGTTLEHELRHFHDFLLSYTSVHTFWVRLQAFINATPLIRRLLESKQFDVLPFPILQWAEKSFDAQTEYLSDALVPNSEKFVAWHPAQLVGPYDAAENLKFKTGNETGYEHQLLLLLQRQLKMIDNVRGGFKYDNFPFSFTPRFVFEITALIVQSAAVYRTYGQQEFLWFLNTISEQGTIYTKSLSMLIALFCGRSITPTSRSEHVFAETIPWEQMLTATTWCVLGCSNDGDLLYPELRFAKLLESINLDLIKTIPANLSGFALLEHLDELFGTTKVTESIRINDAKLNGFLNRTKDRLATETNLDDTHKWSIDLFEGVIRDRHRVIKRFLENPDSFLEPYEYAGGLPSWPQCPVHLDLWDTGFGIQNPKHAKSYGAMHFNVLRSTMHADEPVVGDVLFESFFPGRTSIPIDSVLNLRVPRTLADLFIDPQQTSVADEETIRRIVNEKFGKTLIRLI